MSKGKKNKNKIDSRKEDIDLINGALKGKQECYEKLMKKYYSLINNLIKKMIFEKDEVEDLTQEAL